MPGLPHTAAFPEQWTWIHKPPFSRTSLPRFGHSQIEEQLAGCSSLRLWRVFTAQRCAFWKSKTRATVARKGEFALMAVRGFSCTSRRFLTECVSRFQERMRLAVVSTTGSQEFATMANLYQWSARQAKAAAALPKPQSTHPPPHPGKLGIAQRVGPIAGIWDHDCRTSSRCICSRASTMLPDGKASVSARPRLALPSQLQVQASADCRSPHTTVCRHDAQGTSTRWQVVSLSICLLYNTMLSTLTIRCTRQDRRILL